MPHLLAPVDLQVIKAAGVTFARSLRERLGELVNTVVPSEEAAPWTFGVGALMRSLARRGVL